MGKYTKDKSEMSEKDRAWMDWCERGLGTEGAEELTNFQERFGGIATNIAVSNILAAIVSGETNPISMAATAVVAGAYRYREILLEVAPEAVARVDQWLDEHQEVDETE
jgi:hypothetical protein